jgi:hypothetical protein
MLSLKCTASTIIACFVALPWGTKLMKAFWPVYLPACLGLLAVVWMGVYCVWWRYRPLVENLID